MDDYISREAAYKTLTEYYHHSSGVQHTVLREALNRVPSADVRPVVLCRDCKHFNPYPGDCTDGGIEGVCKRHNSIGVLVMDEDFCSDAERI